MVVLYDVFKNNLVWDLSGRNARKKWKEAKEDRKVFAMIVYCHMYDPIRRQDSHLL